MICIFLNFPEKLIAKVKESYDNFEDEAFVKDGEEMEGIEEIKKYCTGFL